MTEWKPQTVLSPKAAWPKPPEVAVLPPTARQKYGDKISKLKPKEVIEAPAKDLRLIADLLRQRLKAESKFGKYGTFSTLPSKDSEHGKVWYERKD